MWGCLAKVLLHPKSTFDSTFIGYEENIDAHRFLVIKSENGLVEVDSIIETKNVDFFEIFFLGKQIANNKFKEILELSLVILLNQN